MVSIAARRANRDIDAVLAALRARFGERFTTAASVLEQHGRDESYHTAAPPDAVVYAQSTEEVVEVVKLCAEYKVPLIPYGTGTSLEGHVAALEGGICLDVSRMNKVLRVSPDDLDCTVECGVTRNQLNAHLRDTGLFFRGDVSRGTAMPEMRQRRERRFDLRGDGNGAPANGPLPQSPGLAPSRSWPAPRSDTTSASCSRTGWSWHGSTSRGSRRRCSRPATPTSTSWPTCWPTARPRGSIAASC